MSLINKFPVLVPATDKDLGKSNDVRAGMFRKLQGVEIRALWSATASDNDPRPDQSRPAPGSQIRLYFFKGDKRIKITGTYKTGTKWKFGSVRMTTSTSKMDAVSFSIPAGTITSGGSCIAAQAAEFTPGHICRICYAWGRANYGYPSTILSQVTRLQWLRQSLEIQAGIPAKVIKRYGQRQENAIERVAQTLAVSCVASNLGRKVITLDNGLVLSEGPTDYFRLHDSGDFFSPEYVAVWTRTVELLQTKQVINLLPAPIQNKARKLGARAVPTRVWAPTRMWANQTKQGVTLNQRWIDLLRPLASRAKVTIRPSALKAAYYQGNPGVGDPPPDIPGLSAGSGVGANLPGKVRMCPVYTLSFKDPVTGDLREAKSCTEAKCRWCWDAPKGKVTYGAH